MLPYSMDLGPKFREDAGFKRKWADHIWLEPVAISVELLASVMVLPSAFSLELTYAVPLRTASELKVRLEA